MKSTEDAIALLTLKTFSSNLLPKSGTKISRLIDEVENLAKGHQYKPMRDWVNKVDIVPRYQPLFPPKANNNYSEIIYDALYRKKGIRAKYLASEDMREYWPVRLIQRERVLYVICATKNNKDNIARYTEYAMHRFNSVEPLDASPGFPLSFKKNDIYTELSKREKEEKKPIGELVIEVFGMPAQHMSEVSFDRKHKLTTHLVLGKDRDGKAIHTKIVAKDIVYTYELFSWLLGFGAQIKILKPIWLRIKLRKELENTLLKYQ